MLLHVKWKRERWSIVVAVVLLGASAPGPAAEPAKVRHRSA